VKANQRKVRFEVVKCRRLIGVHCHDGIQK
jgi:hypothetical protein